MISFVGVWIYLLTTFFSPCLSNSQPQQRSLLVLRKHAFGLLIKSIIEKQNESPNIETHMNGAVKKIVSDTVIGFVRNTQSSGD